MMMMMMPRRRRRRSDAERYCPGPMKLTGEPRCYALLMDYDPDSGEQAFPQPPEEPGGEAEFVLMGVKVRFFLGDDRQPSALCSETASLETACFGFETVARVLNSAHVPPQLIRCSAADAVSWIESCGRLLVRRRRRGARALRMAVLLDLFVDRLPRALGGEEEEEEEDGDNDDEDEDDDDEYDDDEIEFVPACDEFIDDLERVRVRVSSDYWCSVCLEGVSVGSEAVRLPCSHHFHGDCIVEWLHTSKYCPVCRYEMPSYA